MHATRKVHGRNLLDLVGYALAFVGTQNLLIGAAGAIVADIHPKLVDPRVIASLFPRHEVPAQRDSSRFHTTPPQFHNCNAFLSLLAHSSLYRNPTYDNTFESLMTATPGFWRLCAMLHRLADSAQDMSEEKCCLAVMKYVQRKQ